MNQTTVSMRRRLFSSGETLATKHAADEVAGHDMIQCIERHVSGDWGIVPPATIAQNSAAIASRRGRVWSAHPMSGLVLDIVTDFNANRTIISVRSLDGEPL